MKHLARSKEIEYGVCARDEVDAMCNLLAEVFSRNDPPAVAAGLTASEFKAFVQLVSSNVPGDGLTVVARLVDSGELVGALLTEDASSPVPAGMEHLSPKFDPIVDILGQLGEEYRGNSEVAPGEQLHLFLLGVSPQVGGLGVAQELVRRCMENGARLGFRTAVTEATNRASQHIFRKAGFVERVERSYAAHRFNGRACFESVSDQGGPILMDRSLTP